MRFRIQSDRGDLIRGYVVPDNPAAISRVAVSVDGRRVAEVAASKVEPVLKERGWHSTGQCQFVISEKIVPNLAEVTHLEIHDVDTNVLIHRRPPPDRILVEQKTLLVSTGIHPESEIQEALFPHFRYCYFGANKLSEEILGIIFSTPDPKSTFISGNLVYPRHEYHFLDGETLTMMLVHDPFVNMANRLLWLRDRVSIADDPEQSWRLGLLAEAASFVGDYDFEEPRSLKRLFRMLPEQAYHLLYNPLTRQLGTRVPEDRVGPGISILAVETLARIGLVGHRDYFEAFVESIFDRLGIQAEIPVPTAISTEARALAGRLRELGPARDMVNFDEVLSDGVLRSVSKSWGS